MKEDGMNSTSDKVKAGALMLMAGGIIGAGLALLFAPQSGKRTRRDIARVSRKMKDQATDAVEEFSESVHEMVDSVSDKAADLLDKGKDLAHSAKKDVLKAIDEGQARLEKEKLRLAKLLS
jgi:gas vesicle protein